MEGHLIFFELTTVVACTPSLKEDMPRMQRRSRMLYCTSCFIELAQLANVWTKDHTSWLVRRKLTALKKQTRHGLKQPKG